MFSKVKDCVPWVFYFCMIRGKKADPSSVADGLEGKNIAQEWNSSYAKLTKAREAGLSMGSADEGEWESMY